MPSMCTGVSLNEILVELLDMFDLLYSGILYSLVGALQLTCKYFSIQFDFY